MCAVVGLEADFWWLSQEFRCVSGQGSGRLGQVPDGSGEFRSVLV